MKLSFTALLLALLAPVLQADDPAANSYFPCRSCHGDAGQGSEAINAPALAGQLPGYLARQLTHYRQGVRGGHGSDTYGQQMALMAANLKDDEIGPLASYIASFPGVPRAPARAADTAPTSYRTCVACHGGEAQGNESLGAPRLAGLSARYIQSQLIHFRDGVRGTHEQDSYGRQMVAAVSGLSDGEIQDLAIFLEFL